MAVLSARLAAVALAVALSGAACYQPSVRDCVVSCLGAGDCAADQVCGADGWCAAPAIAGQCAARPDAATDAADDDAGDGSLPIDAAAADADADADAASMPTDAEIDAPSGTLRFVITGRGRLLTDLGGIECAAPPGDCTFAVTPGTTVTITAVQTNPAFTFSSWSTPACATAVGTTCVVTTAPGVTLVGAVFD